MFELILNEYFNITEYRNWSVVKILEHVESKSDISDDISYKNNCNTNENAKNKAGKILSSFDKSFSSTDVKQFIDRLKLKRDQREFHTTVCRNVASASTLQALEEYDATRQEIEIRRNSESRGEENIQKMVS
ncbi:7824_t:CDS:2 [Racocetra fulgida]|uniref:7824_t:CDS:1 n=1 Tax=Racocetra fulgida TaxID=60492 RepID=A0A9N9ABW9_9GLOM|nr:7824_t:CDS:2 [Racocetra fulgida]